MHRKSRNITVAVINITNCMFMFRKQGIYNHGSGNPKAILGTILSSIIVVLDLATTVDIQDLFESEG